MRHYEVRAQQAAEHRLELYQEVIGAMGWDEELSEEVEEAANELAGPCCEGCNTCEVREVLDAAYPILKAGWEAELRLLAAGPQLVADAG